MSHYHAIVWIDHQRATAWHFSPTAQEETVVHAQNQHQRVHSRKSTQEFAGFLHEKYPQLGKSIVAVENADHPTDAQILDYARRHFPTLDRMQ